MSNRTPRQCPTCGAVVTSMDEHLARIAERRAKYGASWDLPGLSGDGPSNQLLARRRYTVTDYEDVATEPEVAYTRAEYRR